MRPHGDGAEWTGGLSIDLDPPWLTARFATVQRVLSWAVHRPGLRVCDRLAWLQVRNADLPEGLDAATYLRQRLAARGLEEAVGLMTSSPLDRYQVAEAEADGVHATAVITLGLSNGERVGARRWAREPFPPLTAVGTINTLCRVSVPLAGAALLEAMSIVTQARTTALLHRAYEPAPGVGAVTGTGTDCIAVACPAGAPRQPFAGLHTAAGEAIGAAVLAATCAATDDWLSRMGPARSDKNARSIMKG